MGARTARTGSSKEGAAEGRSMVGGGGGRRKRGDGKWSGERYFEKKSYVFIFSSFPSFLLRFPYLYFQICVVCFLFLRFPHLYFQVSSFSCVSFTCIFRFAFFLPFLAFPPFVFSNVHCFLHFLTFPPFVFSDLHRFLPFPTFPSLIFSKLHRILLFPTFPSLFSDLHCFLPFLTFPSLVLSNLHRFFLFLRFFHIFRLSFFRPSLLLRHLSSEFPSSS